MRGLPLPAPTKEPQRAKASAEEREGGVVLVSESYRGYLRLRKNQLRALEICRATVPSYVGDVRPDRNLKFQSPKHHSDDGNVTACNKTSA